MNSCMQVLNEMISVTDDAWSLLKRFNHAFLHVMEGDGYSSKDQIIRKKLQLIAFTYLHNLYVYEYMLSLLRTYNYTSRNNDVKFEIEQKLHNICNWCAKLFETAYTGQHYANFGCYPTNENIELNLAEGWVSEYYKQRYKHVTDCYKQLQSGFEQLSLNKKLELINYFVNYSHATGTLLTGGANGDVYLFDEPTIEDKITQINHHQIERKLQQQLGY